MRMGFLDYSAITRPVMVLLSLLFGNTWSDTGLTVKGPSDICERETFNASCGPHEVILMRSSMYGMMQLGRCIRQRVHNAECNLDVLDIMDGFCSGLNTCSVRAASPVLLDVKRCPLYTAYLQASYSCLKVLNDQSHSCRGNSISAKSGFLSSSLRSTNGPGTSICPWTISTTSRLNITLYKFIPFKTSPLSSSSSVCFEVGVIQEGSMSHGILSCGSDPRVKVIHLSSGGQIRVHFKDKNFLSDLGNFVLHFEAIGCKEPGIPPRATLTRSDGQATITCSDGETKWELNCRDGEWEGEVGECPSGEKPQSLMGWIQQNTRFSLGLLAMVSVGCALVIFLGGFCLYVTYFYVTRKSREQAEAANYNMDIYKLQTMQRLKASRPPSIAVYERTTSLHTPPGTMRRNTDYQRMNPIDPDTVSHHSYVLYDHVPKPLPPIPIQDIASSHEKKHIYETPLRPNQSNHE